MNTDANQQLIGTSRKQALQNISPGWKHLVEQAYEAFEEFPGQLHVAQVKNKFGQLRIYVDSVEGHQREFSKLQATIDHLCEQSLQICQACGGEALDRGAHGHTSTLCGWHAFLLTHSSFRVWEMPAELTQHAHLPTAEQARADAVYLTEHAQDLREEFRVGVRLDEEKIQEFLHASLLYQIDQKIEQGQLSWMPLVARVAPELALAHLKRQVTEHPSNPHLRKTLRRLLAQPNDQLRQQALRVAGRSREGGEGRGQSPQR